MLKGLCGRSWERIWVYVGGLGSGSGPPWAALGADQGLPGRSWGWIRAYVGGLGNESGRKVAQARVGRRSGQGSGSKSGPGSSGKAVLGANQGLPGRSWGWIRAYVGGLGSGSGRKVALARAGRRSWERIRAYLGGLGGGSEPMWAVLGANRGEKWPRLEWEGDLGRDLGRKVALARAGARSTWLKPP